MARRVPYRPLSADVHARALAEARENGRKAAAARYGIGVATLERALAFAAVSPLVYRAIESATASTDLRQVG